MFILMFIFKIPAATGLCKGNELLLPFLGALLFEASKGAPEKFSRRPSAAALTPSWSNNVVTFYLYFRFHARKCRYREAFFSVQWKQAQRPNVKECPLSCHYVAPRSLPKTLVSP